MEQLRHNCFKTNLVVWHLQSPFQYVQNIQLGACRFQTSSSKTYGCTELSRRRQADALTSRNFHKAIRHYNSHNHGLINGRICIVYKKTVALVRKQSMPTEQPSLVGEVVPTFADRACCVVSATDLPVVSLGFLDRSRYYFFQVATQLSS
jgi:hypothetical protein